MKTLEDHFGFTSTPFTREIPVDKRLDFDFLAAQTAMLEDTVRRRMSAVLLAPAGTGKSSILRSLEERLPKARYQTSYFKVGNLTRRDLCRDIATAVGARSVSNFPGLIHAVQERFEQDGGRDGLRTVLIFDDAHALRPEGLEMVKILTNFSYDSRLVVSVVLAGHPSLRDKLYRPEVEDVRQRLAHCGELRLLSRDESLAYIDHRLTIAGCRTPPFDGGALEALYEMSRGNMRALDNLSLKSLSKAAAAGAKAVSQQHVVAGGRELCL
jgi:type II secretory pathway predicted ATPase ExeA